MDSTKEVNKVTHNCGYGGPMHTSTNQRSGAAAVTITAALLALAALAGCGSSAGTATLDTVKLERAIAGSILTGHHVYTLVRCPAHVPQRRGDQFACTANLSVGSYPVYVTETDADGHVSYGDDTPLSTLDTQRVEQSIAASIYTQRGLRARVACPPEVLQQRGLAFTCTAAVGNRRYPFAVTESGSDGRVRYVGR
jgi:Domain of unknown function (DUF4333)